MEHDLNAYRSGLLQSKLYVGSPGFLPAVCWEQGKNGNVVSDKIGKTDAVMSIVGRVLESRLNCEPHGNFNPKYGPLEGAKFQLQLLVKPAGTPFEKDFEKAFDVLTKVQGQAASTQDRRNFIVTEAGNKNFRFGERVFEKRATPLDIDGGEQVDETTENWPILVDFRTDLEKIKPEYRAMPLSVFRNDAFVRPEQVRDIVKGALVEVHFELHHYHIRKNGYDSFNGSIEQIIVLQPSDIQPISAYKRKNVEEGPIRLKPSLVLQMGSRSNEKPGVGRPETAPLEQGMQPVPGPSTRIVERAQVEAHVHELSQSLPGIIDKEDSLEENHEEDAETVGGETVKGKGKKVSK